MYITKEEYDNLKEIKYQNGNNGTFRIMDGKLLKSFKGWEYIDIREKAIDYLLGFKKIEGSGYPLEKVLIKELYFEPSYLLEYFPLATPFDDQVSFSYQLDEKVKASIDSSLQLKETHNRNCIFNDMHAGNLLIDKRGGHLIDFEDIVYPNCKETPIVKYYLKYFNKEIDTSIKTDQFKHLLASLGLIYSCNLEDVFYLNLGIEHLPFIFSHNKDLKELCKDFVSGIMNNDLTTLPYFYEISSLFNDPEKVESEKEKVKIKSEFLKETY